MPASFLFRTVIVGVGLAALASLYRSPLGQRWAQSLREALFPSGSKTDANGVEVDALNRMTSEGGLPPNGSR